MATTRDLFADHNVRCTAQRRALYEALVRDKGHPTAEELYRTVMPDTCHLSLATVYNTLETLCKIGLARKLPTNDGCCRYDADTSEHLHVCFRDDGEIIDVPSELGGKLLDQGRRSIVSEVERELGVEVDGLSIQLVAHRNGRRSLEA